jgi:ribosomal protein S18 acetylase RimI-like enzyme
VLPDRQGSGIGRMLMDELERRLRAVGATKLNLLVERGNAGVADFYRKLGYAPDELLFMTKLLN